jgi:dTDP-4-dehydrorhamnose 3,5-epimerase
MVSIIETSLPGVVILEPEIFGDARGFFIETYREDQLRTAGIQERFVQDNHSRSTSGVLRGLHFQLEHPQGKLVRVARGAVFDVAVDVRQGSPNFGKWFGTTLDDTNLRQMYIPPGFAHGFLVLSEVADFIYKCTDYYHPQSEQGILWNDPKLDIRWPGSEVRLSKKDRVLPTLDALPVANLPSYDSGAA